MPPRIRAFGTPGPTHLTFTVETQTETGALPLSFRRSLWFDQDIDGGWLVWAAGPDDALAETGAIVVHEPTVAAFLEELGQLLASPQRFLHEPRFGASARRLDPDSDGRAGVR